MGVIIYAGLKIETLKNMLHLLFFKIDFTRPYPPTGRVGYGVKSLRVLTSFLKNETVVTSYTLFIFV